MNEFTWTVIGMVIWLVVLLGVAAVFNSISCDARYDVSQYGIFTGCMVQHEGQMVPEDRIWFERNSGSN